MYRNIKQYVLRKAGGFTVIEMLLTIVILGVSLAAIIAALNNGMSFIQKTRERTIAINLAREGIEAMYQIRDSNRYRWAGKKEKCWLKQNPLIDEWSAWCEWDNRIWTGNYILLTNTTWWQQYFYLSWPYITGLDLSDEIGQSDKQFSLCKGSDGVRSGCIGQEPQSNEWLYFRQIEWIGLFLKNTTETWWQLIWCANGWVGNCWDDEAKEYRFCSKVAYIGRWRWEVELCGLLTNFQKK